MDQDKIVAAIQANMDGLERISTGSVLVCAALIASTVGHVNGWNMLGMSFNAPAFAFIALLLITFSTLLVVGDKFARIDDYCAMLDRDHMLKAMHVLFLHPWTMNPFAFLPKNKLQPRSEYAKRGSEGFRAVRSAFFFTSWPSILVVTIAILQNQLDNDVRWPQAWGFVFSVLIFVVTVWFAIRLNRIQSQLVCEVEDLLGQTTKQAACKAMCIKARTQRTMFGILFVVMLILNFAI